MSDERNITDADAAAIGDAVAGRAPRTGRERMDGIIRGLDWSKRQANGDRLRGALGWGGEPVKMGRKRFNPETQTYEEVKVDAAEVQAAEEELALAKAEADAAREAADAYREAADA